MNDFEEMQRLYEESVPRHTGVPVASNKGTPPSRGYPLKYEPNQASPTLTYRRHQIPTTPPGAGSSRYAAGQAGVYEIPTVAINSDEEIIPLEELPAEKQMTNLEVIAKIDDIIDELKLDSEKDLDQNALYALGKLKLTL